MPSLHRHLFSAAIVAALSLGLLCNSASNAQTPTNTPHGRAAVAPSKTPDGTWDGLSPTQQKILAPLESDWDYMFPDSRKKWIYLANIYPKMNAQDQERLQSRMTGWSNLSQKDRRIARENYLASLQFPAEKKVEAWSAYQKLSDEQKKKLAEMEAKKKPNAINAPTLQQHAIKQETTPPPPAPRPRAVTTETAPITAPASTPTNTESQ